MNLMEAFGKVGVAGTVHAIGRAFDMMEIAERVIKRAGGRRGNRTWEAFKLMSPGALIDFGDALYEAHCRELVQRVIAKQDTRPGTLAEMAVLLHDQSLKAPLSDSYLRAYEDVLVESGIGLPYGLGQPTGQYAWPSEKEEIRRDLARLAARPERTL